jgi:hypothetical protein
MNLGYGWAILQETSDMSNRGLLHVDEEWPPGFICQHTWQIEERIGSLST